MICARRHQQKASRFDPGQGWKIPPYNGANALRIAEITVAAGSKLDLVVLDARDAREAFANRAPRRWVIRNGRLIGKAG